MGNPMAVASAELNGRQSSHEDFVVIDTRSLDNYALLYVQLRFVNPIYATLLSPEGLVH